ncbi:hypothetical protein [Cronobacter sakazakii]|uniref:hypothetical protein n=1 Tax=Cronobacter sakazakii TaxID=28141 RepID=UPI001F36FA7F|nr:hypothetical protein [Cronobacter sakazakii]
MKTEGMQNNDELIAAGHELAKCLDSNTPLIDIAKMIVRLADKLDVTTLALREKTKQCDAEHNDVLIWEKTMFMVCGEDVVKSVAEKFASLEASRAALAAENAALKDYRPQPQGAAMMEALDAFFEHEDVPEQGMMNAFEILFCEQPETPATEAFLREVRAQVWIKGSEPPEFGRYWVRYETDVGPQYCSAKWMEYNFCAPGDTNIHKIWLADQSRSINSLKGVTHYAKLPEAIEGGAA